jgi:hypothetical protein
MIPKMALTILVTAQTILFQQKPTHMLLVAPLKILAIKLYLLQLVINYFLSLAYSKIVLQIARADVSL